MKNEDIARYMKDLAARLDVHNQQLGEHMRRTALLEQAVELQKEHFERRNDDLDARTLRIYDNLDARMKLQEAALHGLPQKALQYVSIVGGIAGMLKLLF
jgi:hypothetical protein